MRRFLAAALAAPLLLPACGGGEEATDEASAPGDGTVVEVSLQDFAVQPASSTLDPGTYTFRVVNDGDTAHALVVDGPTGEVETQTLEPGAAADLTVDLSEPGGYELYCPVGHHRERGMETALTVGGGEPATETDETTTEEDEDSGYDY